MSDLKQCPFCGSVDTLAYSSAGICWVECWSCDAVGPTAKTEAEAIAAWNQKTKRVCVWVKNEKPFIYHNTGCGHDLSWSQTPKFCTECGGKVEVQDE